MLLSADSVEWLTEHLGATAAANDLDLAYAFTHPLNHARRLTREDVRREGELLLRWWVEFKTSQGERITSPDVARIAYPNHRLMSSKRRDHVAFNAALYVVEEFQKNGFSKALYPAEELLYRRWNVAEIQLHARGDGCVVWIKKFGFQLKDPEIYATEYPEWARRNGEAPSVPSSAAGYPASFLRSRPELHAYKVLR